MNSFLVLIWESITDTLNYACHYYYASLQMQKLVDWLKKQKSWDNWTIMMHLPSHGKCPQWMHVGRGFCQGWKTTELCWRLQLSSINFMNKYVLSLTFCLLFAGVLFPFFNFILTCQDLCMVDKLFTDQRMWKLFLAGFAINWAW